MTLLGKHRSAGALIFPAANRQHVTKSKELGADNGGCSTTHEVVVLSLSCYPGDRATTQEGANDARCQHLGSTRPVLPCRSIPVVPRAPRTGPCPSPLRGGLCDLALRRRGSLA